jgi:hypothetical protein
MLIVSLDSNDHNSLFPSLADVGYTVLLFFFDSSFNQISSRSFLYTGTELISILDIDNDGLNEVIFSNVCMCQGDFQGWINIYCKDFTNPILKNEPYFQDFSEAAHMGNYCNFTTNIKEQNKKLVLDRSLSYYIGMGWDINGNGDNRFIKSGISIDEYYMKSGQLYHIIGSNNLKKSDLY